MEMDRDNITNHGSAMKRGIEPHVADAEPIGRCLSDGETGAGAQAIATRCALGQRQRAQLAIGLVGAGAKPSGFVELESRQRTRLGVGDGLFVAAGGREEQQHAEPTRGETAIFGRHTK